MPPTNCRDEEEPEPAHDPDAPLGSDRLYSERPLAMGAVSPHARAADRRGRIRLRQVGGIVATTTEALFRYGRRCALACALLVALVPVGVADVFTVTEPWVRVAPDAKSAEAYMELLSSDGAKVVGVRSDIAADVAMRPPGATRATVLEIRASRGKGGHARPGRLPVHAREAHPFAETGGSRPAGPDRRGRRRQPAGDSRDTPRSGGAR